MSMFQGATNITINGGTFTVVSESDRSTADTSEDIVAILASHSAKAGLLDAAERFDAPICSDGTRISTLSRMKRYVQQDGPPSMFWLHGPAGIGKSALAQSLALSLQDEGNHAASFFFSRTAPGRKNGNQLFVTLACQLAINIPAMKPLLANAVKENPFIFTATNAIKIQRLIVDPINQLQLLHRLSCRDQILAQTAVKRGLVHPRLILVDGLDECDNPQVQRDILICIAHVVQRLSSWLPFRFVIASRPESHILSTFEHDPIFSGPHGVNVERMNLGDDEDADAQITTFLMKEFAEIRKAHPIRQYLPRSWPLPRQIKQIVLKSSKGFVYPATVIQYIKMPENRPDECLDRILGSSEIPAGDKPLEHLDSLYLHIFESVSNVHKQAVWNTFHFLVVPYSNRQRVTPQIIERHFGFKPGHVEHVLRGLLCLIAIESTEPSLPGEQRITTIRVLHASLPDFLLDRSRSGPFYIDIGNAHATLAASLFELSGHRLEIPEFYASLEHVIQAHLTDSLHQHMKEIDVVTDYCRTFDQSYGQSTEGQISCMVNPLIEFLQILAFKQTPVPRIIADVRAVEAHVVKKHPLASALYPLDNMIVQGVIPMLRTSAVYDYIGLKNSEFLDSQLASVIFRLHVLLLIPHFPSPKDNSGENIMLRLMFASSRRHAQIAYSLVGYVIDLYDRLWTSDAILLKTLAIRIFGSSLEQSAYSTYLISASKDILGKVISTRQHTEATIPGVWISDLQKRVSRSQVPWFEELAPHFLGYLRRMQSARAFTPHSQRDELASLASQYQQQLTYFGPERLFNVGLVPTQAAWPIG